MVYNSKKWILNYIYFANVAVAFVTIRSSSRGVHLSDLKIQPVSATLSGGISSNQLQVQSSLGAFARSNSQLHYRLDRDSDEFDKTDQRQLAKTKPDLNNSRATKPQAFVQPSKTECLDVKSKRETTSTVDFKNKPNLVNTELVSPIGRSVVMPLAKKKGAPKMSRLTSNKRPHKRILGLKSLLRRQALKRRLKNARVKLKAEESRSIDPNKDLKNRSSKKEKKSVLSGAGNSANKATKTFNITTVEELYDAIFQKGYAMKDLIYQPRSERKPLNVSDEVANHPVLSLIAKRVREGSTPGNRAEGDTAKLAMSIEGGGMRGAVSAGMAAAIATLGLADVFDVIYGSSAGSIVGAYMVSRQMCIDVYTEILVAAKETFICKKRLMGNLVYHATREAVKRGNSVILGISGNNKKARSSSAKSISYHESISHMEIPTYVKNCEDILPPELTNSKLDAKRLTDLKSINVADATNSNWVSSALAAFSNVMSPVFPLVRGLPSSMNNVNPLKYVSNKPGMNITFVLDGIMCKQNGLRPLDLETFEQNNKRQPLRVIASGVSEETGDMVTASLGIHESDFFGPNATICANDKSRKGLFACLAASMSVPGATGPPLALQRNDGNGSRISHCFDAFCYEPMPYRSAVEEDATHVLVLRTRPDGCAVKTKPTLYESVIAPFYFNSNNMPQVARYFERGGQQFRYLEDVLTLEKARKAREPVPVPPTKILHWGNKLKDENIETDPSTWKKAHLYPVVLPQGATELSTVSTDHEEVLNAVRSGFATAFELLAPAAGFDLKSFSNSATSDNKTVAQQIAEMVFPDNSPHELDPEVVLQLQLEVKGEAIPEKELKRDLKRFRQWMQRRSQGMSQNKRIMKLAGLTSGVFRRRHQNRMVLYGESAIIMDLDQRALLKHLPGFKEGKLSHLSKNLRMV